MGEGFTRDGHLWAYMMALPNELRGPALAPPPVPISPQYNAWLVSVHDGDTINVVVQLGPHEYAGKWDKPLPVRLLGCNAAELGTPGGDAAAEHLSGLIGAAAPLVLSTETDDKYAPRWDAAVAYIAADGTSRDLVRDLIAEQWAAPWNGVGVKPVPPWPRTVP